MKPTAPKPGASGTIAADIARKSATPGEPYGNAAPGQHASDTLGPKGYQPPGGPTRVLIDQQQTKEERARLNPGLQFDAEAEAKAKAEAKKAQDTGKAGDAGKDKSDQDKGQAGPGN